MEQVKKAGLGYTIGNVLLKGVIFLTLPIFTNLLSIADFGLYNTYVSYELLLSAILGLGIYGTIKKAFFDFKDDYKRYLSSSIVCMLVVLAVFLGLTLIFKKPLESFTSFPFYIIVLCLLQGFGSAIIQLFSSHLLVRFKYKEYLLISVINTVVGVGLSILLILTCFKSDGTKYIGRIIGYATPVILIGLIITVLILLKGKTLFRKDFFVYLAKIGFVLIPHVVAQYILNQSDRVIIAKLVDDSTAGIYSYAYSICSILFVVYLSLDGIWTPWTYYQFEKQDDQSVKSSSIRYIIFGLCLYIGFVSIAPELYKLMAPAEYNQGMVMLLYLSLSMFYFFLYYIPVSLEYYDKKTLLVSVATVAAAALNIVLNILLIPVMGYIAAAITTLIAFFLLYVFHLILSLKFKVKTRYSMKTLLISTLGAAVISVPLYFLMNNSIISTIIRIIIIVCLLVFMFFYFKKDLLGIINKKKGEKDVKVDKENI